MFINLSNHSVAKWGEAQKKAAHAIDEERAIHDLPFPNVSPTASTEDIAKMADELVDKLVKMEATVVLVQGEMTLTYAIVSRLQETGITAVAACTERKSVEKLQEDGSVLKTSVFEFVQFRSYL